MKKYRVTLYYHTNITVEVQAENEQDAEINAEIEASKNEYNQAILSGLERDSSPDIVEIETHDDNNEADTTPVVSIAEQDGQKGVRFCIGDMDMFIEAHDLDDGKEYEWPDAMKRLKEVGKETFSHKQGLLMAAYCDEINAALREIGGDELKGYCWSSTEYNDYDAWYVNFSSGSIYSYLKFNSRSVRPVAAFKKLDIR